jgi:DNA polymerase-3 subunit gamma/tau
MLPEQVYKQMEFILQQEDIESEPAALKLLSRAADGSMRDGLSLLDQAIVYGNGKFVLDDVCLMLGTIAQHPVHDLLTALADGNAPEILRVIGEMADLTPDFGDVLQQILQVLHRIALYQAVPAAIEHDFDAEMIVELAKLFSPEDIQLYYQIALIGRRDLDLAPDPKSGFEMIMLRKLAFKPATLPTPSSAPQPKAVEKTVESKPVVEQAIRPPATFEAEPNKGVTGQWGDMIAAMRIGGMTRELANNCVLQSIDDKVCVLLLDPGHKQLSSARTVEKLQKSLQDYCGNPVKLNIITEKAEVDTPAVLLQKDREDMQRAAVEVIENDEAVQAL